MIRFQGVERVVMIEMNHPTNVSRSPPKEDSFIGMVIIVTNLLFWNYLFVIYVSNTHLKVLEVKYSTINVQGFFLDTSVRFRFVGPIRDWSNTNKLHSNL